jgi:hypothetical protein
MSALRLGRPEPPQGIEPRHRSQVDARPIHEYLQGDSSGWSSFDSWSAHFLGGSTVMGGSRTPRRCTTAEPLTGVRERVHAIPVLVVHLDQRALQPLVDRDYPTHRQGGSRSLGWVRGLWLTPRLSEGDRRLNLVAPWATPRRHTRRECTGQRVHSLDVRDDPLAMVCRPERGDALECLGGGTESTHAPRL